MSQRYSPIGKDTCGQTSGAEIDSNKTHIVEGDNLPHIPLIAPVSIVHEQSGHGIKNGGYVYAQ